MRELSRSEIAAVHGGRILPAAQANGIIRTYDPVAGPAKIGDFVRINLGPKFRPHYVVDEVDANSLALVNRVINNDRGNVVRAPR